MSDARNLAMVPWFCLSTNSSAELRRLSVKTPALVPLVPIFIANCERALRIALFPEAMYAAGKRFQLAESIAFFELTGRPYREDAPGKTVPDEVAMRRDEILAGKTSHQLPIQGDVYNDEVVQAARKHDMISIIDEAMFNQVTSTWTAFETLFGDLWEAAVNVHPKKLATLDGGTKKQAREKDSPKQIPLFILQNHDYNLATKMGTILREQDKVRFTRLDNVQEAYSRSFDDAKINDAIADQSFNAVSAVRNLIVHKAGTCDEEYLKVENELTGKIPRLIKGERLELDGLWMTELIRPPLRCSMALIELVDDWLQSH